jgi:hypothetical protein
MPGETFCHALKVGVRPSAKLMICANQPNVTYMTASAYLIPGECRPEQTTSQLAVLSAECAETEDGQPVTVQMDTEVAACQSETDLHVDDTNRIARKAIL